MNILEKIDVVEQTPLVESGVRNIRQLSKDFDSAIIWMHMDTDGITSAIGMKAYLERYGIKTIDAYPIQYGDMEYKLSIPPKGKRLLYALVDFAHAKPIMTVWYDHHDSGHEGATSKMSTSFIKAPSNAGYISSVMSPSDIFPPADTKIINTVDSADFASQGLTPDDIFNTVFTLNKEKEISKNHLAMGLVVNKLLLVYKNKKDFLKKLVLQSKPSLFSMYNTIVRLAKEDGYRSGAEYTGNMETYVDVQKDKIKTGTIDDVKSLKNGESIMVGNTIVQYGGGSMIKAYDRYVPFKNHPNAQFIVIAWPMGLVQVSKNPFIPGKNPYHLGEISAKVMEKFKSDMQDEVSLGTMKRISERGAKEAIMGFTFNDFVSQFKSVAKGLGSDKWSDILTSVTAKENKYLSAKQKEMLDKVTVSKYDIMKVQSGGHKDISNIALGLIPGNMEIMKGIFYELAKEMQDKELV